MANFPKFSDVLKNYKKAKASQGNGPFVKVKVLCDVTFQPLDIAVSYFLNRFGMRVEFDIGNYDQVAFEALESNLVDEGQFDFVYIHSSALKFFTKVSVVEVEPSANSYKSLLDQHESILSAIARKYKSSTVIVNTLELPPIRLRGNYCSLHGATRHTYKANNKLLDLTEKIENIFLNDINYLSSRIGLDQWYDFNHWVAFKQPFSDKALTSLGSSLASIMASEKGQTKKLIVTDLDNTLWGGVVGDDGIDGVHIGQQTPKGELFSLVQGYFADLHSTGILLSVSSKNDIANVTPIFDQDKCILTMSDFSSVQINWDPKSLNIKKILSNLNLRSDSAVFVDDNPAEIHEVSQNLPDCYVITYEHSPIELLQTIDVFGLFEVQKISQDDLNRNLFYKRNQDRIQLSKNFISHDNFLKSLKMSSRMLWNPAENVERVSSLINKTNQFNLTQMKLSETKVRDYASCDTVFLVSADLKDNYGDNGIVSVVYGNVQKKALVIENWVMSCRVFNRGLEKAIMCFLTQKARQLGMSEVQGTLSHSEKNGYCRSVFESLGFETKVNVNSKFHSFFLLINKNESEMEHENDGRFHITIHQ